MNIANPRVHHLGKRHAGCRDKVLKVIQIIENAESTVTFRNLVYLSISLLVCKHPDILIPNSTYQYRLNATDRFLLENALRAKENMFLHKLANPRVSKCVKTHAESRV